MKQKQSAIAHSGAVKAVYAVTFFLIILLRIKLSQYFGVAQESMGISPRLGQENDCRSSYPGRWSEPRKPPIFHRSGRVKRSQRLDSSFLGREPPHRDTRSSILYLEILELFFGQRTMEPNRQGSECGRWT